MQSDGILEIKELLLTRAKNALVNMLKVRPLQAKGFRERRTEKHQHYGERQESSVQNGDRYRDVVMKRFCTNCIAGRKEIEREDLRGVLDEGRCDDHVRVGRVSIDAWRESIVG